MIAGDPRKTGPWRAENPDAAAVLIEQYKNIRCGKSEAVLSCLRNRRQSLSAPDRILNAAPIRRRRKSRDREDDR